MFSVDSDFAVYRGSGAVLGFMVLGTWPLSPAERVETGHVELVSLIDRSLSISGGLAEIKYNNTTVSRIRPKR